MSDESKAKVIHLDEIQVGHRIFEADGLAVIKTTHGGEEVILTLPIRSAGVTEVLEEVNKTEPQPPGVVKYVRAEDCDPDTARKLKIPAGGTVLAKYFDVTNEDYVAKQKAFLIRQIHARVDAGYAGRIKDEGGQEIVGRDRRIEALRKLGMSMPQFVQLADQIDELTTLQEERRRNFSGRRSGSDATPAGA
jgi:hypothetical protein